MSVFKEADWISRICLDPESMKNIVLVLEEGLVIQYFFLFTDLKDWAFTD